MRLHPIDLTRFAPAFENDVDRSELRSPDGRRESRPVGGKESSKRTRAGRTVLYWMAGFERIMGLAPRSMGRGESP